MERMALWKLERRVNPSVNTQFRGVVGKRPWTDRVLPNPGNVQPCGIQHIPIPHEVSGEPRMHQL